MLALDDVYLGDCHSLIGELPESSIDVVITDLPYGIDYQSAKRIDTERFPKIANDKKPFIDFIKLLPRVLKPSYAVYLFTRWDVQQPVIDEMEANCMKVKNVLIWDKGNHSMGDLNTAYGMRYESIVFSSSADFRFQGKRPVDIIRCPKVSADRLCHPNEKPVDLIRKLIIDSVPMGGVVLDCTCGSGSTLVAAIRERRHFIGFEIDRRYYDISRKRIDNEKRQLSFDFNY